MFLLLQMWCFWCSRIWYCCRICFIVVRYVLLLSDVFLLMSDTMFCCYWLGIFTSFVGTVRTCLSLVPVLLVWSLLNLLFSIPDCVFMPHMVTTNLSSGVPLLGDHFYGPVRGGLSQQVVCGEWEVVGHMYICYLQSRSNERGGLSKGAPPLYTCVNVKLWILPLFVNWDASTTHFTVKNCCIGKWSGNW